MFRGPMILIMLLTLAAGGGPAPAADATQGKTAPGPADVEETYELFRMLADAVDQVERNYVQPISRRELIEAALEGIVRKLDPYSSYIKAGQMEQFRQSLDGNYSGIGVKVDMERGQLVIRGPVVGAPAYRAGLRSGDRIVEIDGRSTKGMRLAEAVRQIKGPAGTRVHLTVRHRGGAQLKQIDVARELVRVETVLAAQRRADGTWDYLIDPGHRIGYVRISVFGGETPDELARALREMKRQDLRGLILDLRFNPGGLLSSAIRAADLFVADGRIVTVTGRNTQRREVDARTKGTYGGFPMAVLVNRYSASASEILAACLQDHGRAVIVGQRTWGKGSVQNVIELEGGRSALRLTTSRYLRPNGRNIHHDPGAGDSDHWGVKPSAGFELELSDEETTRLFQHYRYRDLEMLGHGAPAETRDQAPPSDIGAEAQPPAAKPAEFVDRQLRRALDYLTAELARAE